MMILIIIEHSKVTCPFLVYSRILKFNLVNSFIHQDNNKGYCLQYPLLLVSIIGVDPEMLQSKFKVG